MGKRHALGLVYSEWCPHCVSLKPAWQEAVAGLRPSGIDVVEIDASLMQSRSPMTDAIRGSAGYTGGVPFIFVITPESAVVEYKGDRTPLDIARFVHRIVVPTH
jgi:thiol-disulfide isomerase/thioredoxin